MTTQSVFLHQSVREETEVGETLLTVNEAAARLAIGRTMLYELIASHELRTVKIGRARRIPESAVDDWIRRRLRDQVESAEHRPEQADLNA